MTQQENTSNQRQRTNSRSTTANVEPDETYGLVSVLYHSLQGADTCNQYISDARRASATELVSFFQDYQRQQQQLAERAKQLLAEQLEDEIDDLEDEEDEDEDDEESEED